MSWLIERRGRIAVADNGARFELNEVPIEIPMPAIYIRMLAYAWGESAAATGRGLVRRRWRRRSGCSDWRLCP